MVSKTEKKNQKKNAEKIVQKFPIKKKLNTISYKTLTNLRKFFILIMIFEEIIYWTQLGFGQGLKYKIIFLTEWNHFLTLILYTILVIFKIDKKMTKNFSSFFILIFGVQTNSNLTYWIFIHKESLLRIDNPFLIFLLYFKHLSPIVFILIDFFFNNILHSKQSLRLILPYGIVYGVFNYYVTVFMGIRVYDSVTYNNLRSYIIIAFTNINTFFFALAALKLQEFKFDKRKFKKIN